MTTYHLQQDVVLVPICGEQFLIAAGAARGKVPYIEGVTQPGAYFWRLLEQQRSVDDMIRQAAQDYQATEDVAAAAFWKFARLLQEKGYLTMDEGVS